MNTQKAAKGLGIFSIGLGLIELAATRSLSKAVNMPNRPGLLRFFGAREFTTGVGILSRKSTGSWIWARVAGDVMDMVALGSAFASSNRKKTRNRIAAAFAAVAGVTVLDFMVGRRMTGSPWQAFRQAGEKFQRIGEQFQDFNRPSHLVP